MYIVLMLALLTACSTPDRNQTLHVGTNGEFAPFTYVEDGELVGFDIDIAKEVAVRLGKGITFKDIPFEALIPELALEKVDFLAAGMSYTEERAKRVSFSKPYLEGEPLLILTLNEADAAHTLEDLKGKTVVVNEGYTADTLMSGIEGIHLIRLSAPTDAFLSVMNGRADAFVTSKSTVNSFFEKQASSKFSATPIEGTGETCALVFSKHTPQLQNQVQVALDQMKADGTLLKLKQKWKLQ